MSPPKGDLNPSCLPCRSKGRAAAGPTEAPSGPPCAPAGLSTGEPHPEPGPEQKRQTCLPHRRGLPSSMLRLKWEEPGVCRVLLEPSLGLQQGCGHSNR